MVHQGGVYTIVPGGLPGNKLALLDNKWVDVEKSEGTAK